MEYENVFYIEVYDNVKDSIDEPYFGIGFQIKQKDIKRFLKFCEDNKKFVTISINYTEDEDNAEKND